MIVFLSSFSSLVICISWERLSGRGVYCIFQIVGFFLREGCMFVQFGVLSVQCQYQNHHRVRMCGCDLHFCLCSCYIVCSKFILYMQYVQTYTNAFLAIIVVQDLLYVRLVHMMRGSLHRIVLFCFLGMPLYGFELLVNHLMYACMEFVVEYI